ncbi:hypothetical protein [Microbacterium ureisolvens]|uniref:Uncharacterized protein n=1 Tax=Microbacterium ureisolvens TaxID=2781186 RepID=A0ABS7HYF8_9MICO|nr:hypothetical protein [Microbacterium ureisolvens]MBW9110155.1 hypothetical protein [Microbacterium ureisolvens]
MAAIAYDIQGGTFWSTSPVIYFANPRLFMGYSKFRLDKIFAPDTTTDNTDWTFHIALHQSGTLVTQWMVLKKANIGTWYNFRQANGNLHHPYNVQLSVAARFYPSTQLGYGRLFQGDLQYQD